MAITPAQALATIRVALGILMMLHGLARVASDGVGDLGVVLSTHGVPVGIAFAWGMTLLEVLGTPFLIAGRYVRQLSFYFAAQLATGIVMVHFREGWFVVGNGQNGMEFSALLIVGFLAVALASPGARK